MRAVVTGATGFIGGRLAESLILDHGATVRALVRRTDRALRLGRLPVEIVQGDVTDPGAVQEAVRGADVVFHCVHDPRAPYATEVRGADIIAASAIEAGVRRIVYLSSVMAYGEELHGELTEERPAGASKHPYVRGKREAERRLLRLPRTHGIPVTVLQPTVVYGPYGRVWTEDRLDLLRSHCVPLLDGGRNPCNAVYVDDVVQAMVLAAQQEPAPVGRYLISAEKPITWADFYGAFEEVLGVKATRTFSEGELERLRRHQRRAERRKALRAAGQTIGTGLKEIVLDPEFRRYLLSKRYVRALLPLARRLRTRQQAGAAEQSRAATAGERHGADGATPPVFVPGGIEMSIYRSTATVSIDRALSELGYRPRYDFTKGMQLTAGYLEWAALI